VATRDTPVKLMKFQPGSKYLSGNELSIFWLQILLLKLRPLCHQFLVFLLTQ